MESLHTLVRIFNRLTAEVNAPEEAGAAGGGWKTKTRQHCIFIMIHGEKTWLHASQTKQQQQQNGITVKSTCYV